MLTKIHWLSEKSKHNFVYIKSETVMQKNVFLILLILPLFSLGQDEYPSIVDSTDKGGVMEMILPVERYNVNVVEEISTSILNLNDILSVPKLQIGQAYTFTFVFTNPYDFDVIVADIIPDCVCTQPTWTSNTIAPNGTRNVSITILPSAPGTFSNKMRLFIQNPQGTIPVAIKRVELNYIAE